MHIIDVSKNSQPARVAFDKPCKIDKLRSINRNTHFEEYARREALAMHLLTYLFTELQRFNYQHEGGHLVEYGLKTLYFPRAIA